MNTKRVLGAPCHMPVPNLDSELLFGQAAWISDLGPSGGPKFAGTSQPGLTKAFS